MFNFSNDNNSLTSSPNLFTNCCWCLEKKPWKVIPKKILTWMKQHFYNNQVDEPTNKCRYKRNEDKATIHDIIFWNKKPCYSCNKVDNFLGDRWVSNPRPSESQSDALTNWATISVLYSGKNRKKTCIKTIMQAYNNRLIYINCFYQYN